MKHQNDLVTFLFHHIWGSRNRSHAGLKVMLSSAEFDQVKSYNFLTFVQILSLTVWTQYRVVQ